MKATMFHLNPKDTPKIPSSQLPKLFAFGITEESKCAYLKAVGQRDICTLCDEEFFRAAEAILNDYMKAAPDALLKALYETFLPTPLKITLESSAHGILLVLLKSITQCDDVLYDTDEKIKLLTKALTDFFFIEEETENEYLHNQKCLFLGDLLLQNLCYEKGDGQRHLLSYDRLMSHIGSLANAYQFTLEDIKLLKQYIKNLNAADENFLNQIEDEFNTGNSENLASSVDSHASSATISFSDKAEDLPNQEMEAAGSNLDNSGWQPVLWKSQTILNRSENIHFHLHFKS